MSAYSEPHPSERRRPSSLNPQGLKPVCGDCHRELREGEPRVSWRGGWRCAECEYKAQVPRG